MTLNPAIHVLLLLLVWLSPVNAEKLRLGDVSDQEKNQKEPKSPGVEIKPEQRKKMFDQMAKDYFDRGVMAYQAKKLSQAKILFERSLSVQPNNAMAKSYLDKINAQTAPKKPKNTPLKNEASHSAKQKRVKALSTEMEKAISKQDWRVAEDLAERILKIDPVHDRTARRLDHIRSQLFAHYRAQGVQRENQGNIKAALRSYASALEYKKDPELGQKMVSLEAQRSQVNKRKSDEIYFEALTASQAGDKTKALDLCKQALRINPDNLQAKRMLERLQFNLQ